MLRLIQNLGIEIQRAENKHQFRSIVYTVMALINLGLSIILCKRFGAVGSAIGTAISLIVANGLVMNIYYHKKCNIDIITFWKNILKQRTDKYFSLSFKGKVINMISKTHIYNLLNKIRGYMKRRRG